MIKTVRLLNRNTPVMIRATGLAQSTTGTPVGVDETDTTREDHDEEMEEE
jgi:hypothetical protein